MKRSLVIVVALAASGCVSSKLLLPSVDAARTAQTPPRYEQIWSYTVQGDTAIGPSAISDDGIRTQIFYAPDQPLPAVFAIGPTGNEMSVNGYMRSNIYVIDRVFDKLVFRIDKARATAVRASQPLLENGS